MIIKRKQDVPGLHPYVAKTRQVRARRMNEDFVIETGKGWYQAHKGDWLVRVDNDLWIAVEHSQFQQIYRPYKPGTDCIGPCDK